MGVVYRAIQLGTGRRVAIKVIRPECYAALSQRERDEWLGRFRLEAAAMKDHENIVRVYHTGESDGAPFIVMEFVDGQTLRDLLRSGSLEVRDVVECIEQAARGLHHAHQHGVLHRDLKPANILIEASSGVAKVADFGLATLESSLPGKAKGESDSTTVVGTRAYMPPEQARDSDEVTVASDIFSLGATLWDALAGRPPTPTPEEALRKDDANHETPSRLKRICRRCLATRPEERYSSAALLADELQRLRENRSGGERSSSPTWAASCWGLAS